MTKAKVCHECGAPGTSEPIRQGRETHYLCDDCLWGLAEKLASGLWKLTRPQRPPTDEDRERMLCAAMISLNQRIVADAIADRLGLSIPWKED